MEFNVAQLPHDVVREIGVRLASVRLGRNLTRAELSERSGVAERTLARLENGEGNVRLEAFVSVCSALALTERFESLLPRIERTPEAVFKKEKVRRRARHAKKTVPVWGDEK